MSNETNLVVVRNGISLALVDQVFGKTSDRAGQHFFAPVIDVTNMEHLTWAVADNLNGMVNKQLRLIFADIDSEALKDSTDETTGQVDQVAYKARLEADWADFTAGVAKLSDLEEQIGILQDQIAPLMANENFGATQPDGSYTAEHTAISDEIMALNRRITPLRKQFKAISEVYKERAAKRKAKAAASPTKTAVPAGMTA